MNFEVKTLSLSHIEICKMYGTCIGPYFTHTIDVLVSWIAFSPHFLFTRGINAKWAQPFIIKKTTHIVSFICQNCGATSRLHLSPTPHANYFHVLGIDKCNSCLIFSPRRTIIQLVFLKLMRGYWNQKVEANFHAHGLFIAKSTILIVWATPRTKHVLYQVFKLLVRDNHHPIHLDHLQNILIPSHHPHQKN